MSGHPPPELLVGDLLPWVEEHLEQCPRCRIDRRLLLQAEAEDAGDATVDDLFEAVRATGLPDPSITWRSSVGTRASPPLTPPAPASSDLLFGGTDLGRYTVEALLGRGGMAAVYQVRHNDLGTRHALKVVLVPSTTMRERLLREGRAQGALRHSNIVAVTDTVTVDGSPGLVVELVEGPSLDELLQWELLTLPMVDAFVSDILAGVGAAHAAGFVHRDLKPANVLLDLGSGRATAKVADFGLVKAIHEGDDGGLARTRTGATMGTPAYMAPEQIRDASRVDARTDVFALGAILYELVTGVRAFGGRDTLEVFNHVTEGEPTPLEALRADVPDRMVRAIEAALRKDPADRPATVEALAALWNEGRVDAGPTTWSEDWLERVAGLRDVRALPTSDPSAGATATASTATDTSPPLPLAPTAPSPPPRAPGRGLVLVSASLVALALGAVAVATWALQGSTHTDVPEALTGTPRIYRLDGTGGHELFPSLSPHGDVVVYSDGVDLFTRRVGATSSHELTADFAPHATQPSFSPDGAHIALSADGALWVMGERGDAPRPLAEVGYWPSWSPDGREIVYATGDEADIWVARQRASEVWVVDATSGERRKVADYGVQPVFVDDGRAIAFFDGNQVDVVHADGSGPVGRTHGVGVSHFHPVATDDGLFTLSNRGEAMWIRYFPTPDSDPADVMALPITWGFDVHGGRIVASVVDEHFAVLAVDLADGSHEVVTTQGAPTSPAIGPDGERVWVKYQSPERLVQAGPGGEEQTLVQGGSLRAPAFSPDGRHIALSADQREGYGLYLYDVDTTTFRRLARGNLGPVHWSPDGTHLSWSNGQPQIDALDTPADAWGQADHEALDGFWAGAFAPDGRRVVARSPAWTLHTVDVESFALSAPVTAGSDAAWLDDDTWLVARDGELLRVDVATGAETVVADLAPWRVSDQPSLAVRGDEVLVGARRIGSAVIHVADYPGPR